MNFRVIFDSFMAKLRGARPFVRTKVGSRLALLCVIDFILLFFAPAMHAFVGAALFGCVASVYLVIIWRRYDRDTAIVPAVLLSAPMLTDMLIYSIVKAGDGTAIIGIITAFLMAIAAMFLAAKTPVFNFIDRINDTMYVYIGAGIACAVVVVAAWILNLLVLLSWWILCIIAFLVVLGIFLGVVFSTAAYTASDGRRQARRKRVQEAQEKRYNEYRPRKKDTKVYNLDDDDFIDIE